jgi:hypothetical protein
MKDYIIIGAKNYFELAEHVNKFLEEYPEYQLFGGPYSDSQTGHYQAAIKIKTQQILKD